tara:strand:- start:4085 stop:4648 length:564 start_codon:yes stop_codon:yes gene_type:complete
MDKISLTPPELYGNIGYSNSIIERVPIVIYLDNNTSGGLLSDHQSGGGFKVDLGDTINIDRITDILLDSFLSLNGIQYKVGISERFILGIKEFDLKTISNNQKVVGKIIIPNGNSGGGKLILHKASKFNYIGTITPTKLKELTITLTTENGKSIAIDESQDEIDWDTETDTTKVKVWINLILVPRKD